MMNSKTSLLLSSAILALLSPGLPSAIPRSIAGETAILSDRSYDYKQALNMSLLFYEAQRSGKLPKDNRIPWRGDSALDDRGHNGEDLTGGYYDAADYVKFVWMQAASSTLIAWGLATASQGYESAGLLQRGLETLRWASDFLIKCHISPNELYGQIGDFKIDQKFWGRPEEMNMTRPAYKIDADRPGSDLAGEVAAALAATSIVFRQQGDEAYADKCLKHAEDLYKFASNYRGLHHLSLQADVIYYESTDYEDELAWAAVWIYKATNKTYYLEEAEHNYDAFKSKEKLHVFSLGHRIAGVQVLMASITDREKFKTAATSFCDHHAYHQLKSPDGLLYIERVGVLSRAANVAFVCLQLADKGINSVAYENLAREQIGYILGDNGRSFVVGFGNNSPKQPHHAASSCKDRPAPCGWEDYHSNKSNPQILYGALVSGPNPNDYFVDRRDDFIYTEVTIEYNAGFQSALATLLKIPSKTDNWFKSLSDSNDISSSGNKILENLKAFNHTEDSNQIPVYNTT